MGEIFKDFVETRKVTKTIKAKIVYLTKIKEELLSQEYENLQKFLQGEKDVKLHSHIKYTTEWRLRKIKSNKEYPMIIHKQSVKVVKSDTKIAQYWVRIPVAGRYGGIWVAIKPHEDILPEYEIGETQVFRKNGEWYIHITVSKEVELKNDYAHILAVDVGERVMACVCGTWNSLKPIFYGKEIRSIRRHYAWLRRRLQKKKLLKKVKEIGNKESRKVNDLLHKISRAIVNLAKEHNAIIVMGNLKGFRRNAKNKGRLVNRIIHSWAYYKFQKMVEYKAVWEGIKIVYIDEKGTSKTCHRCGNEGKRKTQGCFECPHCGLKDYNADYNGVKNILKRFSAYMVENGAVAGQPLTVPSSTEVTMLVATRASHFLKIFADVVSEDE